jgi:hypothetical protein
MSRDDRLDLLYCLEQPRVGQLRLSIDSMEERQLQIDSKQVYILAR